MSNKVFLVGIGPGSKEHMSFKAMEIIKSAEVIIGYKKYLDLINDLVEGKEIISKDMMEEVERAKIAVEKAKEGKNVVIVSSGDPGIYAMASIVFEFLKQNLT